MHNLQYIEKLTFVFVKSLYLNIKYRFRIYIDTVCFGDIITKTKLVVVFDFLKICKNIA